MPRLSQLTAVPKAAARGPALFDPFAVLAAVLWGTSFPTTQVALRTLSPFASAWWRNVIGLVFVAVLSFGSAGSHIRISHFSLAHWLRLAILSFLGALGLLGLLNFAVANAGPVVAAFLLNTYPALTILLAPLVIGEHPPRRRAIGAIISVAGAFLLLGGTGIGRTQIGPEIKGGLLALAASACFTFYLLLTRRWTHAYQLDARAIAFFSPLFSAPPLLALAWWSAPEKLMNFRPDTAAAALWLGVFCSGLAYVAVNHSLRRGEASSSSLPLLLVPVISAVLSFAVLGSRLDALQILGAAISLAGMVGASL